MAGLYMRNGSLLVNSVGTALQGCCCQTDCGDQVPTTLFATIIDDNANCPCIDGDTSVITLTRSAETGHWSGSGEFGSCGVTIHLELQCSSDGEWTLETSDCAVDS